MRNNNPSMLSLFRSRHPQDEMPTCNDRIRGFWEWFQQVAPEFRRTINEGGCDDLAEPTSAKVSECFPGFAWVYGPPSEGKVGHSFTLSGEGVECRQLLALHWLQQAPEIDGWSFHASRQPGPISGHVITMAGMKFDPKEIWVTPSVDVDGERVDLTVWHPAWPDLEKRQKWRVVFLFLDEVLGEYGTGWWIGEIRLENDRLRDSFPLEELGEYVRQLSAAKGWKKFPPGVEYSLLKIKPSDEVYPRSDLLTLTTAAPDLFRDHREAKGELEDPFAGTGADYVYVSFDKNLLTVGNEVEERGELEDLLDGVLKSRRSGQCVGGGFGLRRGYVDLLIFDGKRSMDLIVGALRGSRFAKGASIEYFAKEKRKQAVRL